MIINHILIPIHCKSLQNADFAHNHRLLNLIVTDMIVLSYQDAGLLGAELIASNHRLLNLIVTDVIVMVFDKHYFIHFPIVQTDE